MDPDRFSVDDDELPVTVVPAAEPGWSLWGDAEI